MPAGRPTIQAQTLSVKSLGWIPQVEASEPNDWLTLMPFSVLGCHQVPTDWLQDKAPRTPWVDLLEVRRECRKAFIMLAHCCLVCVSETYVAQAGLQLTM